jgi:hypothetical protein
MTFVKKQILALTLAACLTASARAQSQGQTLTIDARARVEDAALLDGEFAHWNYGASPFIEAGFTVGIYAEHNAVSLIRFNLEGVRAEKSRAHASSFTSRVPSHNSTPSTSPCMKSAGATATGGRVGASPKSRQTAPVPHGAVLTPRTAGRVIPARRSSVLTTACSRSIRNPRATTPGTG